jgi:hypothetical protein
MSDSIVEKRGDCTVVTTEDVVVTFSGENESAATQIALLQTHILKLRRELDRCRKQTVQDNCEHDYRSGGIPGLCANCGHRHECTHFINGLCVTCDSMAP